MKRAPFLLIILLTLALFFGLLSCSGLETAGEPAAEEQATAEIAESVDSGVPTATSSVLVESGVATALPRIVEERRLTLEFPSEIRTGDSDNIRLSLEVDEFGNLTPTAIVDGNAVTGETVEIPNLYETHFIIAEARFDMAGVEMIPSDTVREPLLPGEKVTFFWSVRPTEVGTYRGTVWLYLRFMPKDGGDSLTRTLSAQFVEIEATTFMGLDAPTARWLGAIGAFFSSVFGLPFFEEIVKWLWSKRGK